MADTGFITNPSDKLLQKISDETATIREFLETGYNNLSDSKKKKYLLESQKKRGLLDILQQIKNKDGSLRYDVDKVKWVDILNDNEVALLQVDPATDEGFFRKLLTIENQVQRLYKSKARVLGLNDFPFSPGKGMQIGGNSQQTGFGIASSISDEVLIELGGPIEKNPAWKLGKDEQGNPEYKRISDQARNVGKLPYLPAASKLGPLIKQWLKLGVAETDVKEASLFNILVPFRIGEVATLTYDDVDFESGITKEWKRGNKTRSSVQLSRVALEILRKLRDAKIEALQSIDPGDNLDIGKIGIFSDEIIEKQLDGNLTDEAAAVSKRFTGRMTEAIQRGPNALFNLLRRMYPDKYTADDLSGAKDLRKISSSFFDAALKRAGKSTAIISKITGHLKKDKDVGVILEEAVPQTQLAYITELDLEAGEVRSDRAALDILESSIGRSVGASNVNEIPVSVGVTVDALNIKKGSNVIPFSGNEGQRIPEKPPTPAERKLYDSKVALETSKNILETEQTSLEAANVKKERVGVQLEASRTELESAGEIEQNIIDTQEERERVRAENKAKKDALKPKDIPERLKQAGVDLPELNIPKDATRAERKLITDEWNKKVRKILNPANMSKLRSFLTFGVGLGGTGLALKIATKVGATKAGQVAAGLGGETLAAYLEMTGETGPRPLAEMSEEDLLNRLQQTAEGTYKEGPQQPSGEQIEKEADIRATEGEKQSERDYAMNLFPAGVTTMPVPQQSRAPKAKSSFVEKYEDVLSSTFHEEAFEDPDDINEEYKGFIPY